MQPITFFYDRMTPTRHAVYRFWLRGEKPFRSDHELAVYLDANGAYYAVITGIEDPVLAQAILAAFNAWREYEYMQQRIEFMVKHGPTATLAAFDLVPAILPVPEVQWLTNDDEWHAVRFAIKLSQPCMGMMGVYE